MRRPCKECKYWDEEHQICELGISADPFDVSPCQWFHRWEICAYCGRPLPHRVIFNTAGEYVACEWGVESELDVRRRLRRGE